MSEEAFEDGLVEMVVESVRVHMLSSQHVVILKELDRERYLPIWIGPWEANAIAMRLQGLSPERPLTHDTFAATLAELGVSIRRVVIADLADETFHARLYLESGGREISIDSRPSDALALAVRSDVRIFASSEVLVRAGVEPDKATADLESTGEHIGDERLEVFRDFVNSLEVDVEGEKREGPGPEAL
jgi:bifunctional DNase/RNase